MSRSAKIGRVINLRLCERSMLSLQREYENGKYTGTVSALVRSLIVEAVSKRQTFRFGHLDDQARMTVRVHHSVNAGFMEAIRLRAHEEGITSEQWIELALGKALGGMVPLAVAPKTGPYRPIVDEPKPEAPKPGSPRPAEWTPILAQPGVRPGMRPEQPGGVADRNRRMRAALAAYRISGAEAPEAARTHGVDETELVLKLKAKGWWRTGGTGGGRRGKRGEDAAARRLREYEEWDRREDRGGDGAVVNEASGEGLE